MDNTPSLSDLLQEQLDAIMRALPPTCSFDDWYADGCSLDGLIMGEDPQPVSFALGYLRGAHEALNVTMSEMLEEYGVDTLYICANCERSTRPGTPCPHVCPAKPRLQLTGAQSKLLTLIEVDGSYLKGSDVRVAKALEKLGLVAVEDNGDFSPHGRSDGERWLVTLTPKGKEWKP